MSKHTHHNVGDEITYPTPTVQPLQFRNVYVIPSHALLSMGLLIHVGINVIERVTGQHCVRLTESKQDIE